MDLEMLESMAQDEMTMQDTPIMQVDYSSQINAESTMGAAAGAAVYDTPPPLLRQNPSSVPGGSAPDNGEATAMWLIDIRDMFVALMGKMDTNIQSKMDANMQAFRSDMREMQGEMQRMGLDLQAGQRALKKELEEAKGKMAKEIGMIRGEVSYTAAPAAAPIVDSAFICGRVNLHNGSVLHGHFVLSHSF